MCESVGIYGTVIDPILKPMRKRISKHIQPGQKVVDIACGTGAQIMEISKSAKRAVGVDLSEEMITFAKKTASAHQNYKTKFYCADASNLALFQNNEYDVAIMSLALHQFETHLYGKILSEMIRIAPKIIICDYAIPLPKNYLGYGSRLAEFFAGKEHNKNFKSFYKLGGLNEILLKNGLTIEHSELFAKGAFQLVVCIGKLP